MGAPSNLLTPLVLSLQQFCPPVVSLRWFCLPRRKFSCVRYAHFKFLCRLVQQVLNCQPWVSAISAAYLLCSTAVRRDIRTAIFLICELHHRSVECVLLHSLNAQPYAFAVVNFSDVALNLFYSPVLTRCRIFLQL